MVYILINIDYDGDRYKLYEHNEEGLEAAKKDFEESKDEHFAGAVLAEVEIGTDFGFGNRGYFFGGNVISEWSED